MNFFLEYEEKNFQKRIFKAKKIMIDFNAKS